MPIVLRLKKKKSCWDILPADKEQWGNRELHMGDYESCLQVVHSSSAHSPLARTRSHGHPNRKQDWNVEKADGQDEGEQTCWASL